MMSGKAYLSLALSKKLKAEQEILADKPSDIWKHSVCWTCPSVFWWLLSSVRERYSFQDRGVPKRVERHGEEHPGPERITVPKVIHRDSNREQSHVNPDEIHCTQSMMQKFIQSYLYPLLGWKNPKKPFKIQNLCLQVFFGYFFQKNCFCFRSLIYF